MSKKERIEQLATDIRSREKKLDECKLRAIKSIRECEWWSAQVALGECIGYAEVIKELEYQVESVEVE